MWNVKDIAKIFKDGIFIVDPKAKTPAVRKSYRIKVLLFT